MSIEQKFHELLISPSKAPWARMAAAKYGPHELATYLMRKFLSVSETPAQAKIIADIDWHHQAVRLHYFFKVDEEVNAMANLRIQNIGNQPIVVNHDQGLQTVLDVGHSCDFNAHSNALSLDAKAASEGQVVKEVAAVGGAPLPPGAVNHPSAQQIRGQATGLVRGGVQAKGGFG